MITFERVRLVNWHYFTDQTIEIGNRCLLAGDNGSGKSTVIDAIQYVMAANLRMARFNSAAEERRSGGRDLMGYVRCKIGSDDTEYARQDTITHVMLEWEIAPNKRFICGVCVEAYRDNTYKEHFWIGDGSNIHELNICDENKKPFDFRQFKNILSEKKINDCPTKQQYIKEFTNRLGVFNRTHEVNPYLDSLTRSIGFKPLDSIDKFVCDFILEENSVSIQDMKQNLENYKEADRQAKGAIKKIEALKKICAKAAEWQNYDGLIIKQEFLKLKIEQKNEEQNKNTAARQLAETQNKIDFTNREIASLSQKRLDAEQELRALEMDLASNNAYRLYEEIETRIKRLEHDLAEEKEKAEKYKQLKSQCEALLNRALKEDFDAEHAAIAEEADKYREEKFSAKEKKEKTAAELQDVRSELADLERGIIRFPSSARELKAALEQAGIEARFLAEAAEITDPDWADAVEGWLNTRRFTLLVAPADFQKALEVYDSLPRSVAGAFIPNIEKMRNVKVHAGSLAEIVKADGYARIYIDYTLGRMIRADIESLKNYDAAITKECMTYTNHSASRINEDFYRHHYLGRAAIEKKKKFLAAEAVRLEREFISAEKIEKEAALHEDYRNRVIRSLPKLENLFPSVENSARLNSELEKANEELAAIDTRSFRELENKRGELNASIDLLRKDNDKSQNKLGGLNNSLSKYREDFERYAQFMEEKEEAVKNFANENPLLIGDCESYAEDKLSKSSIAELTKSYESTLKGFRTHAETNKKDYAKLVITYNEEFHHLMETEPSENKEAENLLKRLETSDLPNYKEKIDRAHKDAEKEFKDHFISRLNERIEEARESFKEINEILRTLNFGRDRYKFDLKILDERKGQIEVIKHAAKIPSEEETLFSQLTDPAEKKAVEELFNRILDSPFDSKELRDICDYRTYFHYDIIITEEGNFDEKGEAKTFFLSKVLREKSGGESQTPYYVAIAASFYRFFKERPENTARLVIFDEAFNRMDDERIGKILSFYKNLNLQILTSVPPEKIEAIAPYMDRINVISRSGSAVKVRDCHTDYIDISDIEIGTGAEAAVEADETQ